MWLLSHPLSKLHEGADWVCLVHGESHVCHLSDRVAAYVNLTWLELLLAVYQ